MCPSSRRVSVAEFEIDGIAVDPVKLLDGAKRCVTAILLIRDFEGPLGPEATATDAENLLHKVRLILQGEDPSTVNERLSEPEADFTVQAEPDC